MIDWIYSHPIWLWGGLMVAVVTAVSWAGLLGAHRLVPIECRRPYNDVVVRAWRSFVKAVAAA